MDNSHADYAFGSLNKWPLSLFGCLAYTSPATSQCVSWWLLSRGKEEG